MPRDDLSIDGFQMPPIEHQDAAAVLDDFVNRVANLPEEIKHMQEEIAAKDRKIDTCMDVIKKRDEQIQKFIRLNGSLAVNEKEETLRKEVSINYEIAMKLQDEKVALAEKSRIALDRHLRYLDRHIKALQDRGEFPVEPDFPSTLKPPANDGIVSRPETSRPLAQIHNSASVAQTTLSRHTNQQVASQRMVPAQVHVQHISSGLSSSAPATPAAAILLQRQQRESSAGAPPKRQRTGLSSAPSNSSGLARHSSIGPGTPKPGTPASTRGGSVQPRGMQKKDTSGRKVAPHKQHGIPRKAKPGKSGLSRVKRTGTKNSPSSANDSELSDAESASQEEEDEAPTPPQAKKDADGDEEMADGDNDEGGDDRKYCMCQRVSYGDMVACDNEDCPYEWFHWTCVGLKSEPEGTWICPVCTKAAKNKQT